MSPYVTITLPMLMVLVPGLCWLIDKVYKQFQVRKGIYSVVWKRTTRLTPGEVMFDRGAVRNGYNKYFYPIEQVDAIAGAIKKRKNILVVGEPLSGKTRTVFEAFKKLRFTDVIIPQVNDITIKEFNIPRHNKFWRRKVLYLDDLQKYVERKDFRHLFTEFMKDDAVTIVATCRSGDEFGKVAAFLGASMNAFGDGVIELKDFDGEAAKIVAKETGKPMPAKFDGNIGTILLGMAEMKNRFEHVIEDNDRLIMKAIKRLYHAGIYRGRELFLKDDICAIAKHTCGGEYTIDAWDHAITNLEANGFVTKKGDGISAEEAYLSDAVIKEPHISFGDFESLKENLIEMTNVFSNDPEALEDIGRRAYLIGTYRLTEAVFLKVSIKAFGMAAVLYKDKGETEKSASALLNYANRLNDLGDVEGKAENNREAIGAYKEVLKVYTIEKYPEEFAGTQNNLGNAIGDLGDVEDKADNYKLAIVAFEEALKVYTLDKFPMDYAMTQNNLAVAYHNLGDVEDKAENCRKAIAAYKEALKVYTMEKFPMQYAMTQNNLAVAYRNLGEVENKAANCKLAIAAYEEALKVRTLDKFPMDYAMTQNNLAVAYNELGNVEDKAGNNRKAIAAYEEALKVYSLSKFPMDYAMTQNNLANAYVRLGEVEDKAENCRKAIEAYEKALKVYSLDKFPMQFATTQNNLGATYQNLGDVEDKAENCRKAIAAFREALKVNKLDKFPMQFAATQNNLGNAYRSLGDVEAKAENCKKAIAAYEEALKVRTFDRFPMDYAMTQNNIGGAYTRLGDVENKADNCRKAIAAYEEALKVRTLDKFPMDYAMTQANIGIAYESLAQVGNERENLSNALHCWREAAAAFESSGLLNNAEIVKGWAKPLEEAQRSGEKE